MSLSQLDVYSSVYHVVHPYGGLPFQNVVWSACDRGIKMAGIPFEQWRGRLMQETLHGRSLESLDESLVGSLFVKTSVLSSEQVYGSVSRLNIPDMDNIYVSKWLTFILQNIIH
jgi:hypothetical protein